MPVRAAVLVLFFLSGAIALVYEVLWLRMLILIFGSTQFAVATVLTAFMGGLALGSVVLGRVVDRRVDPLRLYGLLEVGIGLYALAVPWLFGLLVPLSRWAWSRYEPDFYAFSLLRFVFVLLVLLVPTFLMGGTLPVLSRFAAPRADRAGTSPGALYAVNTGGAVAGTVAAGFLLIPAWGVTRALWIGAGLSLVVGIAAMVLDARHRSTRAPRAAEAGDAAAPALPRVLLIAAASSGFISMLLQIAWTRVLALLLGGSVYAFTVMLATFLAGLAAGAAVVARRGRRGDAVGAAAVNGLIACLAGTAVLVVATMMLFHEMPYWFARLYHMVPKAARAEGWIAALQFGVAGAVMFPATMVLGGVFPLALQACAPGGRIGRSVGHVYAAGTLGTIAGSFLGGFFLIPAVGIRASLLIAVVLAILVAVGLAAAARESGMGRRVLVSGGLAILGAALVAAAPPWDTMMMNSGVYQYVDDMNESHLSRAGFHRFMVEGLDLEYYKEGIVTSVMVTRDTASEAMLLAVNGKIDASSEGDLPTQVLSGHLPMLLTPREPESALVIGFASGITVGAVTRHPVESVTAVEIEPAILEASRFFDPWNHRPLEDPRVRVARNDGRNLLLMDTRRHDVIISEPSNPWMTVASNLFTREFFELGRRRLAPGGVFAQWLQIYGMSTADVQALARTFRAAFPHVLVFNTIEDADLILLGSEEPLTCDPAELSRRMARAEVALDLSRVGVESPEDLMTYFLLGSDDVERLTGEGPLNTDDNALIEFRAPRSLHAETRQVNVALLKRHTAVSVPCAPPPGDVAAQREHAVRLADAFARRRMWDRATAAITAAPGLSETGAGRAALERIESARRVDTARPGS
ncbi:MAG: fused MFS/spermidine synthase [Candidatus Polarisedimenticolia bacterium]